MNKFSFFLNKTKKRKTLFWFVGGCVAHTKLEEVINMKSIWMQSVEKPKFQRLEENKKTDVVIIGGGATGILCAYMLKAAGVDCILLEADRICGGVTQHTTAKITLQHGLHYDRMISRYGTEAARGYLEINRAALSRYRELAEHIECNFEVRDSYVYSMKNAEAIEREVRALELLGCQASFTDQTELPFSVAGAVKVSKQAQFHPLRFFYALARDLPIYEQTKALEIMPWGVRCERGEVRADKIIVATHFPILNKHGAYFIKMYQHRSYVLSLKGAGRLRGMYVDEAMDGLSFRSFGEHLLLGGGGHRTGKNGGNWEELSTVAYRYYPRAREEYRWATQDCMTLDSIPYIGQYGKNTPNLFVATGYNKWGMTSSMAAAMLLTDLVQGHCNPYAQIFSPSRSIWHPQLAVNAFEAVKGWITPTVPRCPHLGCALRYNKQEHTWDCPCHGSRFTEAGELIENPSTDDLKGLKKP